MLSGLPPDQRPRASRLPGWTQHPCAPYRVHGPADQRRRRRNGREAGGALCFRAARPPWPARPRCRDARQNRGRGKVGFTASVAKAAATRGEADRALSRRDGGGGGSRTGRGDAKCSPGSELRGRLCEGGGNAAEAEGKGRDGASGPGERGAGARASLLPRLGRFAAPRPPRAHCEVRRRRVGAGRDARERPPRPVAAAASAGPFTGCPGQT